MRLAISNLAWPATADREVAGLLRERGAAGVELAPTKVWPQPLRATPAETRAYRRFWQEQGLEVVALQALLFGRPDLTLFGEAAKRDELFAYLTALCGLAADLGARVLVFGSPKNRTAGALPAAEAERIARDFFGRLGAVAQAHGVVFCIEPNPTAYECDFITRGEDGARLARAVAHPGFGLHLDTAGMHLSGDPVAALLGEHGPLLQHFHVSEPFLAPVGTGGLDHAAVAAALQASDYRGWVSIEMKETADRPFQESIAAALRFVGRTYSCAA